MTKDDEFNFLIFVDWIWRHRIIAMLCLGVSLALTVIYLLVTERTFRAEIVVVPVSADAAGSLSASGGLMGNLAGIAGLQLGGRDSTLNEALALLRSRSLIRDFIEEEGLLQTLFSADWDAENGRWQQSLGLDTPTISDGYRLFDEEIRRVQYNADGGLVTLSIDWTDPQQAAEWATKLISRVNEIMRDRSIKEAEGNSSYLNRELEKTNVLEVRQVLLTLLESQINQIALANSRVDFSFRVVDPAVVSDADDFVRPNVVLALVFGPFLGMLFAVIVALIFDAVSLRKKQ